MTRVRWVAALLVSSALLAGCGRDADDDFWAGREYVALGDSYTAAPGTGANAGVGGCYQANGNYPRLVAEELELELVDVSCGGATQSHMIRARRRPPQPPQFDALSEDTHLVTVRIGANDSRLFLRTVVRCVQLAVQSPGAYSPCSDAFGGEAFLKAATESIAAKLAVALDRVRELAPEARVIVVGYPEWAPPTAPTDCPEFPLAKGDYTFSRSANELLVEAVADAAETAEVDHVDVWSATEGHHMCAEDPWIAGRRPTRAATPYHPYREEQQAVADLVVAELEAAP